MNISITNKIQYLQVKNTVIINVKCRNNIYKIWELLLLIR